MTGSRFNASKARIDLVSPSILTAIARVGANGAAKYGERNWETGFKYSTMYASLMRHLISWWEGEDRDPESGELHTDHIAWNIHAIVEHERRVAEGSLPFSADDRPKNVVQGYHPPEPPKLPETSTKYAMYPLELKSCAPVQVEDTFVRLRVEGGKLYDEENSPWQLHPAGWVERVNPGGYRQGGDPPILLGENV